MVQNIINKKKYQKNMFIFLSVLLTIFLSARFCYSGVLSTLKAQITDEVFQGIGQFLEGIGREVGRILVNSAVNSYQPTIDTFTSMMSESFVTILKNTSMYIGATLALVIFLLSMFMCFWNYGTNDLKDTPVRLLFRLLISSVLVMGGHSIMFLFLDIGNTVWTKVCETSDETMFNFDMLMRIVTTDENPTLFNTVLTATIFTGGAGIFFIAVIGMILLWPLLKNLFRLYTEIVERYIVTILLVYFFPVAGATFSSKNSENILRSYLRMFTCQIFLLIVNIVFIKGIIILIVAGVFLTVPGYIFCLAYLRTAQRIDSYMASMGLNVAQTGASLLDALSGGFRGLANGFRSANSLRKSGGNALSAIGARSSNKAAYDAGKIMSANIGDISKSGLTQKQLDQGYLKEAAAQGIGNIKATPGMANDALNNVLGNPHNRDNANAFLAMDKESQNLAAQNALGNGIKVTNVDTSKIDKGIIGVSGEKNGLGVKANILSTDSELNARPLESGVGYANYHSTLGAGESYSSELDGTTAEGISERSDMLMSAGVGVEMNDDNIPVVAGTDIKVSDINDISGIDDFGTVSLNQTDDIGNTVVLGTSGKEGTFENAFADDEIKEMDRRSDPDYTANTKMPPLATKEELNTALPSEYQINNADFQLFKNVDDSGVQSFNAIKRIPQKGGGYTTETHKAQVINLDSHPEIKHQSGDYIFSKQYSSNNSTKNSRMMIRIARDEMKSNSPHAKRVSEQGTKK